MRILILETSCEKSCIVLAEKDEPIAFKPLSGGPSLSRNLALEVKNLLGSTKPNLVAVGVGPGSYTGIRVGAALAKALAYGWNVPLIGFCSLKAFGPAPVLVDARSGGLYSFLGDKAELIQPTDPRLAEFKEIRSPHPHLVEKRLRAGAILHESDPDSSLLAKLIWTQFLQEGAAPLELNYCSCP
jgi:tRNA threonylcarbamoyl adenosine modification protein YeaZ